MIRGDTKDLQFKIKSGESYISGDDYDEIELQLNYHASNNSIKKLLSKNEITFDSETNLFTCYLSQEDTFKLNDGKVEVQVRIYKLINNKQYCKGTLISSIDVGRVLSNKILKEGENNG